VRLVGVEGTGSYGKGLTRHLMDAGVEVTEVCRPDRRLVPVQRLSLERRDR
jgi:transposase